VRGGRGRGRPGLPAALSCVVLTAGLTLAGCSGVINQPPYTPEELAQECARGGGVYRGYVGNGYCEYQSPGFL
jgi:hypothetical protein